MADQQRHDAQLADAAMDYVRPGAVVGVGAGSACNHVVKALAERREDVAAVVACSGTKIAMLREHGLPVAALDEIEAIDVFIGPADEVNRKGQLIRSKTGFFTQEKRASRLARRYVCVTAKVNLVDTLGGVPIPLEVLVEARGEVSEALRRMGANPVLRAPFKTELGNSVLDVHKLTIAEPPRLEVRLGELPGVVDSGLFARRPADVVLVADQGKIKIHEPKPP